MKSIPFSDLKKELSSSGWRLSNSLYECLSEYEKEFLKLEFTGENSLDFYINRLKELGINGLNNVLDVGCGMGQWTIALSKLNSYVNATDINIGRLLIAQNISDSMKVSNVKYQYSNAESSPFEDSQFDAIFCYGVFMFTHMPKSLSEFYRILKPGGKLYLNTNSLGWYLHLLLDRGIQKRDLSIIKTSLKMMLKTYLGKKQHVMVSPYKLGKMIKGQNFSIINIGPEGSTYIKHKLVESNKYKQKYYGFPAITEVLAEKN